MPIVEACPEGVRLRLKVVPGASRDRVAGPLGERLKVQVRQVPEGGRANAAVCRLLAGALGVRASDLEVVAGRGRPEKTVLVRGLSAEETARRLGLA